MSAPEKDDVRTYSLFIHPKDLATLKNDVWSDETVPAKWKIGKKQKEIEISYRGAYTRNLPRKSFRMECKNPPLLFGAREMHWNAEYNDPSLMRTKLSFEFFENIGVLTPAAQHVLLKLNGSILGLYLQIESVDDCFLQKRGMPEGAIYYASNDDANFSLLSPDDDAVKKSLLDGYTRKLGNETDDAYLRTFIYRINTIPRADFAREIMQFLDVDLYLRWLTGVVCTQNFDGFIQNYALYANKAAGQFQMIPWDYDATWGRDVKGRPMEYDYVPIEGYNTLTARILDIPEFRHKYRKLLEEVLETHFTLKCLEHRIESLHDALRPYILSDPYRGKQIGAFDSEVNVILTFISKRNLYLRENLPKLGD
ncbi:CotH kinase family protein [Fodinisporobacter ferrooxydans]|uniref:CotH kinase family protein n=1 Tax=Fodinisporobacter ferrooxydans TaxID=2901836 RepID=A0ABY4CGQ1_9BACL|nr:CotH kinase family protein [Alicyclobacillaceae bacterium MYW30-H2]